MTCFAGFTYGNASLGELRGSFISPPGHKVEDWHIRLPATVLFCASSKSLIFAAADSPHRSTIHDFDLKARFGDTAGFTAETGVESRRSTKRSDLIAVN